jgi:hypothetical protein
MLDHDRSVGRIHGAERSDGCPQRHDPADALTPRRFP